MINAARIATEFVSMLPEAETPEHTEGHEGFYHLTDMKGDTTEASLSFILRDHDKDSFEKRKATMQKITDELNAKYGQGTIELALKDSYYNMLEVMKEHMDVIEVAKDAISSVGLDPISRPVRGGTDGASLSFKGLPCPNLGGGGYGFHGPFEHCTLEAMDTVVEILLYLASHPLSK